MSRERAARSKKRGGRSPKGGVARRKATGSRADIRTHHSTFRSFESVGALRQYYLIRGSPAHAKESLHTFEMGLPDCMSRYCAMVHDGGMRQFAASWTRDEA